MKDLGTLKAQRRLTLGLMAVLVVVTAGSGCGDDDDVSTTTDGGTTTTNQVPTSAALPDFVISDVSVQPPGPLVPPGQVQILATVSNIGASGYGGNISVQAPGNHSGVIGGLDSGASAVAVIDFPAVSPNVTYTLSLVVDPNDVIAEESESNNESVTLTFSTGS